MKNNSIELEAGKPYALEMKHLVPPGSYIIEYRAKGEWWLKFHPDNATTLMKTVAAASKGEAHMCLFKLEGKCTSLTVGGTRNRKHGVKNEIQ